MKIELPIETERVVIRPLRFEDAMDLGEPEEWIREKVHRFARDGEMSLWAAVERDSGRAVALAGPAVGADRRSPRTRSRLRRRNARAASRLQQLPEADPDRDLYWRVEIGGRVQVYGLRPEERRLRHESRHAAAVTVRGVNEKRVA
jgi:hypothetical protein